VDLVYQNLIECTVRINIPNEQGTGFFVSSGLLLTCRHVVKETSTDKIQVFWGGNTYTPTKVERHPELDLALLWVDITNHIYVALDADFNPFDECFAYGYPPDEVAGNWVRCLAAPNEDSVSMILDSEVIRPGLSGAPLLNKQTQKVCGLIRKELQVRLRGSILQGFGGSGIPVQKIFEVYPELKRIEPHPQWLIEKPQGTEQKFIEALHEFNYRDEVGIFAKFLGADAPVGAFLICGEEQAGQSWLLNRLWRDEVRASTTGVKYKLKVNKKWTIETIWERVGGVLGVAADPDLIAQRMYEYWQKTEPVALILYCVEKLNESVLKQLIEQLWKPLANCAKESAAEVPLLLFLVDTGGSDNTGIDYLCVGDNYDTNYPDIPIFLRLKEKFDNKDINSWANTHRCMITPLFSKYCLTHNFPSTGNSIQIFKTQIRNYNSNEDTTPEDILQKICQLCNHDWQEDFESKFVI
jgi:hypothetical protein